MELMTPIAAAVATIAVGAGMIARVKKALDAENDKIASCQNVLKS